MLRGFLLVGIVTSKSKQKQNIDMKITKKQLQGMIAESINRVLSETQLNELDPRTYASYAQKRAAQGQYSKANVGREAAIDAFNQQYGYDDKVNNGFQRNGYIPGYNTDTYRMVSKSKDPQKKINWNSPDYDKDEWENHGYGTERWQTKNYPGAYDMDDTETYTTYNPQTNNGNSTTYGRMKYQTLPNRQQMYGDYSASNPIRSNTEYHGNNGSNKGDYIARQMAQGTGKYVKGQGWQ